MDRELVVAAFKKVLNDEQINDDELLMIKKFICERYLFSSAGEAKREDVINCDVTTIKQVLNDCILHEIDYSLLIRFGN